MSFEEVVDQAKEMVKRRRRVTYRMLRQHFSLDETSLEDLKEELLFSRSQIRDEAGRGLVWTEDVTEPSEAPDDVAPSRTQPLNPHSYTPPHLAEKILSSHAALQGERKQVTVLFCDLANSTGLAEQLGPEAMHTVLNQFFERALNAVHRYEGTIDQFLGDGFMALFGAPIAHEDHARRAVFAALECRRALSVYNTSQDRPQDIELTIRIGINTGMVVVGAIGDNLRMDYTAVGDTTNVAARLEQMAAPDQIVLSDATHRLVSGYCTMRSIGSFALKGKTEPMAAWEVIAAQTARTRLEVEIERGLTPFVGRERELGTLRDCFAQAQAGHGQLVFLAGEAGMGKSRLLLEFRRQLESTDATWLEGRSLSFGQSMLFHPMLDLLKRNFHIEEGDGEEAIIAKIEQHVLRLGEDLQAILPYVRYLFSVDSGDDAVSAMNPQLRRAELFTALRRLLLRAAEIRPQVVVFEDLHWMDPATEALLVAIADSIPTSRLLWLCTYRTGYTHPFGDRTYHTRLVLSNLSAADSVEMAHAILEGANFPPELESLIVEKAEGNPFFVEEVIKSLREEGAIRLEVERYELAQPLDAIQVPETIQDVLMARIDHLAEAPKRTLQLSAVIGREFTYRLLDRLADLEEGTVTHLEELKSLEFIYEKQLYPELAFMFKHALTQDVAYQSLLAQRRQEWHRLIGQAIEDLYAERLTEQYEVLAY